MVESHTSGNDPLDDDKSSTMSHCVPWQHQASRKLRGSSWHQSAWTALIYWPKSCSDLQMMIIVISERKSPPWLTVKHAMHVNIHTNFHPHYCTHTVAMQHTVVMKCNYVHFTVLLKNNFELLDSWHFYYTDSREKCRIFDRKINWSIIQTRKYV